MWNSGKIAKIVNGTLHGSDSAPFSGCTIDSRKVAEGELFVAIQGEKTDGHEYISKAFLAGASIVLAERSRLEAYGFPSIPQGKAIITVEQSLSAMQVLAKAWRNELDPIVIGITGSSGKTTTKDMVAAVLASRYKVHKNRDNFNNEIGLPLTILGARPGIQIMILEMGMRGLGQIKDLCDVCQPSIGVITNIGTTHMELLGSEEKIAQAKWELIDSLAEGGTAVLNAEDYFSVSQAEATLKNIIFYGTSGKYSVPDVRGRNLQVSGTMETLFTVQAGDEMAKVRLPLPGEHHVLDALAALAVGKELGVSLEEGALALKEFSLSKMRLEIQPGIGGSTLINDVYNANPASMKASLCVLAERGGTKTIAILGEMYELGEAAASGHREVGQLAAQLGIRELITVGQLAEEIAKGASDFGFPVTRIHICMDSDEAVAVTRKMIEKLGDGAWILIKGSRGMRMETVSASLLEDSLEKEMTGKNRAE